MEIVRLPSSNVDTLEGAVMNMFMVCGALSGAALNDFARRYAYQKKKKLPEDYATRVLLPRLTRSRKVYRTTQNLYSLNPLLPSNPQGLNAFWVFLELMDNVDLQTVINGPYPAQISYIKNQRIYHIVSCVNEGGVELGAATLLETAAQQRARKHNIKATIDERFVFIFSSVENMKKAPFSLDAHSIFCVIEYPNRESGIPVINFYDPNEV